MKLKFSPLLLLLFILGPSLQAQDRSYALLAPSELNNIIPNDKNLLIVDLRSSGDYENGHIPGAINLNGRDFLNTELEYGGMMSSKEMTEKTLGQYGISSDAHVVIYDKDSELSAARFWFVLKTYGHPSVQLLDGGFNNWKSASLKTSEDEVKLSPSNFKFPESKGEYYATRSDVKNAVGSKDVIILDVRSDREYSSGHIPGAVNLEWVNNLTADELFKAKDELVKQFEAAGITGDKEIITYCRSGVRASHTGYVLKELLGFKNVRIYDGSWIEWSHYNEEVEK